MGHKIKFKATFSHKLICKNILKRKNPKSLPSKSFSIGMENRGNVRNKL